MTAEQRFASMVVRILAGDASTIDALAEADAATWQALLDHVVTTGGPAPVAAIDQMLAREPRPARWLATASQVLFRIASTRFATSEGAMRPFRAWFGDAILAKHGATAPVAIEVRIQRELGQATGVEAARAIVDDARAGQVEDRLLVDALIVLARRLDEATQHDAALDALTEAEMIAHGSDAPGSAFPIRRLRAASLLKLRRLDEAFEVLDIEMAVKERDHLGGSHVFVGRPANPWDAMLAEAADLALRMSDTQPEWVRALGGIAERADKPHQPALWERFEAALENMVAASETPAADLATVISQATKRRLRKTARVTRALAEEREIELPGECGSP